MTDRSDPACDCDPMLRFSCACASLSHSAEYDDPWVAVLQQRKLNSGTKAQILSALYRQPRTTAQLAHVLHLSAPAIHRHITELLESELIREVDPPEESRQPGLERFYRPNFPVVLAEDRAMLQPALDEVADRFADAFRQGKQALAEAFRQTGLPARDEQFGALLHYLYTTAMRQARTELESTGDLPPWPKHGDGSSWVWWAEEPADTVAE